MDFTHTAPASREEIKAVLSPAFRGTGPKGYALRKEIKDWAADDPDGEKAKWLKGQEP